MTIKDNWPECLYGLTITNFKMLKYKESLNYI